MESRAQFKVKVSTTHRSYSQLTFFVFFPKYDKRGDCGAGCFLIELSLLGTLRFFRVRA